MNRTLAIICTPKLTILLKLVFILSCLENNCISNMYFPKRCCFALVTITLLREHHAIWNIWELFVPLDIMLLNPSILFAFSREHHCGPWVNFPQCISPFSQRWAPGLLLGFPLLHRIVLSIMGRVSWDNKQGFLVALYLGGTGDVLWYVTIWCFILVCFPKWLQCGKACVFTACPTFGIGGRFKFGAMIKGWEEASLWPCGAFAWSLKRLDISPCTCWSPVSHRSH